MVAERNRAGSPLRERPWRHENDIQDRSEPVAGASAWLERFARVQQRHQQARDLGRIADARELIARKGAAS